MSRLCNMESELEQEYDKYKDIASDSKFGRRIRFLVENPQLAFAVLHKGIHIQPCCFGTAVYILGGNKQIKGLWAREGHGLYDYSDALGDFVCIPDDNAPGYAGEGPMEVFQKALSISDCAPNTLISFYWDNPNTESCGFRLRHSGIYLGETGSRGVMFHQLEEGGRFSIGCIEDFEASVSPDFRDSLKKRLYAPSNAF